MASSQPVVTLTGPAVIPQKLATEDRSCLVCAKLIDPQVVRYSPNVKYCPACSLSRKIKKPKKQVARKRVTVECNGCPKQIRKTESGFCRACLVRRAREQHAAAMAMRHRLDNYNDESDLERMREYRRGEQMYARVWPQSSLRGR